MYVRIYLSVQFALMHISVLWVLECILCVKQQVTTVQETAVQVTKELVMKGLTIIRIGDLKRQTQKKQKQL